MWQFISGLVGVLLGGLITWLVSYHYYEKAGDELGIEAGNIRKLANLIGHALEQAGLAQFKRDAKGEMTSIYVDAKAAISAKSKLTGSLTVDRKVEDPKTPE